MLIALRLYRSPHPLHARAKGVTLLELIIVMVLMGIVAAMVVPMLGSGVSTTELKSSARQVAAALRTARTTAVASRQETRVLLNLEERTFQLESEPRVYPLPKQLDIKLFTAQRDILNEKVGSIRF